MPVGRMSQYNTSPRRVKTVRPSPILASAIGEKQSGRPFQRPRRGHMRVYGQFSRFPPEVAQTDGCGLSSTQRVWPSRFWRCPDEGERQAAGSTGSFRFSGCSRGKPTSGLLTGFGEGFQEIPPIHVIQKNVIASIASAHHACPAIALAEADGKWPPYSTRIFRGMPSLCRFSRRKCSKNDHKLQFDTP